MALYYPKFFRVWKFLQMVLPIEGLSIFMSSKNLFLPLHVLNLSTAQLKMRLRYISKFPLFLLNRWLWATPTSSSHHQLRVQKTVDQTVINDEQILKMMLIPMKRYLVIQSWCWEKMTMKLSWWCQWWSSHRWVKNKKIETYSPMFSVIIFLEEISNSAAHLII